MRESGSPHISIRRIGTWLALLIAALEPAAAHDLFRSESRLVVQGREVSAQLTFNLLDFPGVDQNGDKVVTQEEFAPVFERVYATILQHFTLNSSGPPVRITRDKYELFDQHVLLLDLTYVFPQQVLALLTHHGRATDLTVQYGLVDHDPQSRPVWTVKSLLPGHPDGYCLLDILSLIHI